MTTASFDDVLEFHGCYCLDIAMGYRVALAMRQQMQGELENSKDVVAYIGNTTCAADAIQKMLGCTTGKRNLHYLDNGKPVYVLHNTRSDRAVRVYVHYWDHFDQSQLKQLKMKTRSPQATAEDRQALQQFLDDGMQKILHAPEGELFSIEETAMVAPAPIGKFETVACSCCGEYAKTETVVEKNGAPLCRECQ